MQTRKDSFNKGLSLIEIILASALFVLLVAMVSGYIYAGTFIPLIQSQQTQAVLLAQETHEAIRAIRDQTNGLLIPGVYGLAIVNNQWELQPEQDISNGYTRIITIDPIISESQQITISISWNDPRGVARQFQTSTLLTNWQQTAGGNWSNPTVISSINLPNNRPGIKLILYNDYIFAVQNQINSALNSISISNSQAPQFISSLRVNPVPNSLVTSANHIYLATVGNNEELIIVDVTNPSSMSVVNTFDLTGNQDANDIAINNGYLYVSRSANPSGELAVFNLNQPQNPQLWSQFNSPGNTSYTIIDQNGTFIFTATDNPNQEIHVIDITQPQTLQFQQSINLADNQQVHALQIFNQILAIGTTSGQLYLYSISNPSSIQFITSYTFINQINDISFLNEQTIAVALADRNQTLQFLTFENQQLQFLTSLNLQQEIVSLEKHPSDSLLYGFGEDPNQELVVIKPN